VPTTELTWPTTVKALMCGEADRDAIIATMERQLPDDGVAAGRLGRRFSLAGATYRLLDSRILEAAAASLEQDVAEPLVGWLASFQNMREAAAKTLGGDDQIAVTLKKPVPFTSKQGVSVSLSVGGDKVATVSFQLELTIELAEISAAVRHGAIEELVVAVCKAAASFTLDGCPKPLWKPEPVEMPDAHLVVRPPFRIPLVPAPRPASAEMPPQRTAVRPPVPSRGQLPGGR
jgi:hypothetical protein